MKTTLKRLLVTTLFVLILWSWCEAQQYPVFTQYYFNELVINPAYAGNHVQLSLTAMYRNQWVNFPGAPKTFSFSGHTALAKNKVGVGLMVNHDEIGSYKNEHIYASYAYKIHFPNATLSMGLQAGINLLGADYSKLDLQTPGDAAFYNILNVVKPNFGAGLFYTKKNFFIGVSVPFILNNKIANSVEGLLGQLKEARYYFFRSGVVFPIDKMQKVKMNPSILIRTQEGQPLSIDVNSAFIFYDVFSAGASYRSGDSFITFIDLKISESFHFGYSYDWTQSDLNRFSNGTHEFMLNYRTRLRGVHKDPDCPQYYNYR
ncbi:MAG: type IX secretion system membrane protein PorP/SprF [Cyclobacteriaceae bacterium]|nr:type IX secretion system membrane protein PorP/SprF [Cyclobacteriaceae bacterium]MDH4297187.1 type IX secretion system membrane protein PorP/SprF [Cyclobacteriaceae bacterium]MDH5249287.1 type IX secretion system membrane protein PorP/SprF [Cyclobacteriaceae bacterium]